MPESTKDPQQFGINTWLEEELYQTYLHDRKYVDDSWKKVFESNGHGTPAGNGNGQPVARNGTGSAATATKLTAPPVQPGPNDELQPLRGISAKIAENMITSLTITTATSQRVMPVRVLEENRQLINEQRALTGKSKVSYTHLIGWAIIRALDEYRQLNDAYSEQNGEPFRVVRKSINFGLAVDVKGKDGNSTLMVPNIKGANALAFSLSRCFRRHRRACAHCEADAQRFPGHNHFAYQSGHRRNLRVGAAADGGAGRNHCDRRDGLSRRLRPGLTGDARNAGHHESDDDDVHV